MSVFVPDLQDYNLLILANGQELKIPAQMYSYGVSQVRIFIFPEERTIEDVEQILQNTKATYKLQITDNNKENIFATLNGYTCLRNNKKKYKEAYSKQYDNNGNYQVLTSDLYVIELSKPTAEDQLPQFQSDLQYVAIISGIDLDE